MQFSLLQCERRTPQQATGGSPTLGSHLLGMEVTKEARESPLPAGAQQSTNGSQQPQPQVCAKHYIFLQRLRLILDTSYQLTDTYHRESFSRHDCRHNLTA